MNFCRTVDTKTCLIFRIGTPGIGSRPDRSMFTFIPKHHLLTLLISLSVGYITIALLVSQVITLDKSYLAIMCHLSGNDFEYLDYSSRRNTNAKKFRNDEVTNQTKLDPYEKGIVNYLKQSLKEIVSEEIGAPSNSRVLSILVKISLYFIYVSCFVCLLCFYLDYKCFSVALQLFALLFAGLSTAKIGLVKDNELANIADQINPNKRLG